MNKNNIDKTSAEIAELRKKIEQKANIKAKTPADFINLSGLISDKTGDILSPTTLKRLWGYIEGADTTRLSTLNILSKYLGFNHWEDFLSDLYNNGQSDFLISGGINTNDLDEGDLLTIGWNPNRKIVIRFCGNQTFEVIKAEHSKVSVGDTFECSFFLLNEPLYVNRLIHEGNAPVHFVMGAKDGLTLIEKTAKSDN